MQRHIIQIQKVNINYMHHKLMPLNPMGVGGIPPCGLLLNRIAGGDFKSPNNNGEELLIPCVAGRTKVPGMKLHGGDWGCPSL